MKLMDRLRRKERLLLAYRDVFGSPNGKIVLTDLVSRYGVLASSYLQALPLQDGMARALAMAKGEGERNVVLSIIQRLNVQVEDLIHEAQQEEAHVRNYRDDPIN